MKSRGELPIHEIISETVVANFAKATSVQDFVDRLGKSGINIILKNDVEKRSGKIFRKVSYGVPDNLAGSPVKGGCSGTLAGVSAKMIFEKFGDFDPEKIIQPEIGKKVLLQRKGNAAPKLQRNLFLRKKFYDERKIAIEDNRVARNAAFEHAWAHEQIIRQRDYALIRKRRERRRMIVMIMFKRGLIRSLFLRRIDKSAEIQRGQAREEASLRWQTTKKNITSDKIKKIMNYEEWLRAQPKSNVIIDELVLVTRGKYKIDVPEHHPIDIPQIVKDAEKPKEIVPEAQPPEEAPKTSTPVKKPIPQKGKGRRKDDDRGR